MKLIGALIVIIAFSFIGVIIGKNYRRRPEDLRDMQSALQLLETEIVYGATPLPEAFDRIGKLLDNSIGQIFLLTRDKLLLENGISLQRAWSEVLAHQYQHTALTTKDLEILKSLGATLGISDREDQRKHLALAIGKLKAEEKIAYDNATKYAKTWNYLGFLSGLTLVIMIF